jgi:hypothetical protein
MILLGYRTSLVTIQNLVMLLKAAKAQEFKHESNFY